MDTENRREAPRSYSFDRSNHARLRQGITFAIVVGCASVLVSCAPTASDSSEDGTTITAADIQALVPNFREKGFNEQADAFEDGQVTAKEYQDSIQNLRGCVESAGYSFSDPQLSPVTGITYEFVVNSNGRDVTQALEHLNSCEDHHTLPLSVFFLSTHTQKMDPKLKSAVLHCLKSAGMEGYAEGTNLVEIAPIKQEDDSLRKAARTCIIDETTELFPDLPAVSIYD